MEKSVSPVDLDSKHKYRFKFEAENQFFLLGYGATVFMLSLVYAFEIEVVKLQSVLTCDDERGYLIFCMLYGF